MNNITDVFFDLDHTLWDFEKNSALAFETILKKYSIEVDLKEFLSYYIPLNFEYWVKYRNEEISQEDLRHGRLKDTFNLLNYEIEDKTIHMLSEAYIEYLPTYNHLFDGTLEILDYLSNKYKLHIITNGFHDIQNRKIQNSNIAHYFSTITNSESAGVKKPHPIIFEHALNLANTKPENCIMIGDCIDADVRGALQCGLDAILFSEKDFDDSSIKKVSSLAELKNYL